MSDEPDLQPARQKWPYWHTSQMFRVQDDCLLAMLDGKPLALDWLDSLPPWRAIMMLRLAAAGPGPVTQETVDAALAKAREVGGGAGPGWLTGRIGRTCSECGRTTWPQDADDLSGEFDHAGSCQAPPRGGVRHPPRGGVVYVTRDFGAYGLVLMPESRSRLLPAPA